MKVAPIITIATLLITGCTPGQVVWEGGVDDLRTALYRTTRVNDVVHTEVVLSNGQFECALPHSADAGEQQQALDDFLTGVCREGARHLTLHLFRKHSASAMGRYAGDSTVEIDNLDRSRAVRADWYAVQEAFLIEVPGLPLTYAAIEGDYRPRLGDGGQVEINNVGDRMMGRLRVSR